MALRKSNAMRNKAGLLLVIRMCVYAHHRNYKTIYKF
nr:MAG TPA: hypothetical protein [Caudoviricetes sp.]